MAGTTFKVQLLLAAALPQIPHRLLKHRIWQPLPWRCEVSLVDTRRCLHQFACVYRHTKPLIEGSTDGSGTAVVDDQSTPHTWLLATLQQDMRLSGWVALQLQETQTAPTRPGPVLDPPRTRPGPVLDPPRTRLGPVLDPPRTTKMQQQPHQKGSRSRNHLNRHRKSNGAPVALSVPSSSSQDVRFHHSREQTNVHHLSEARVSTKVDSCYPYPNSALEAVTVLSTPVPTKYATATSSPEPPPLVRGEALDRLGPVARAGAARVKRVLIFDELTFFRP